MSLAFRFFSEPQENPSLDLPKDERVEGTVATSVIGLMRGASIFRVHDVKENFRALKMASAVIGKSFNK